MKLVVRQTDDLDTVVELDKACFAGELASLKNEALDASVWWLAEVDGVPVGYAGLQPSTPPQGGAVEKAYLCRAGVLKEARGQGIQKRLVQVRAAYARRLGIPRVYTYVASWNIASMRTLTKCGFSPYHYFFDDKVQGGFIYFDKRLDVKTVKGTRSPVERQDEV